MFFHKKLSKSSEIYYLESCPYPSIRDKVEAMNILIQERHKHSKNCIIVKSSRRRQKDEIYLAKARSVCAFSSADLGHIYGCNVGDEFGMILKGKGPHKPEFAYGIVSLKIYTDMIEYKIDDDTKDLLLHCFFLSFQSSKLETS